MSDVTATVKENRIWWLVLALMAIVTALLVLGYIDKGIWETVVLTLFATFVTGVAVNVVAQGANTLLAGKASAANTQAEGEKTLNEAQAQAHIMSVSQGKSAG